MGGPAPLHKLIKRLLDTDTGTNIHQIYTPRSLPDICSAWEMVKRDYIRKLKITKSGGGYCIEIYRPTPKPKDEWII